MPEQGDEQTSPGTSPATSVGTLLGGRIRYEQPVAGFRTGIEPVLLAAAVPARDGDAVLEAGTGAGAGALCLAARMPGCRITALERDPGLAALAARNLQSNGLAHRVMTGDLLRLPAPEPGAARYRHAFTNPPWHDPAGTASPHPRRDAAKRAHDGLYADWARALAAQLRPRGTLTMILPAARSDAGLAALAEAGFGGLALLPLWPRAGLPAKLALLHGVLGSAGPFRILPGLVLHPAGQGYTPAAEAVLRDGAALPLA